MKGKFKTRFDSRAKCFKHGRARLKGAHSSIKSWYWPTASGERAYKSKGSHPSHIALSIGRRLAKDLKCSISKRRKHVYCPKERPRHLPYLYLAKALQQWKMTVADVEKVVSVPEKGYATAVDLVASDAKGELHICELKTGFSAEWSKSLGERMGHPLGRHRVSDLNKALVQLAFTWVLAKASTEGARFKHASVILINKVDGVLKYNAFTYPVFHEAVTDIQRRIL
jgi:hypothetical protein